MRSHLARFTRRISSILFSMEMVCISVRWRRWNAAAIQARAVVKSGTVRGLARVKTPCGRTRSVVDARVSAGVMRRTMVPRVEAAWMANWVPKLSFSGELMMTKL